MSLESMYKKSSIEEIKKKYENLKQEYEDGIPSVTDEEFDEFEEWIKLNFPEQDFIYETGVKSFDDGDKLPIPMPSLKKIKTQEELARWVGKFPCKEYIVTAKLDGISAEWIMNTKTLLTRHDGINGKNISLHVDNIQGLISEGNYIVRGEIILGKDSYLSTGACRNICAGILNRKEKTNDSKELKFVAYEICYPVDISPIEQLKALQRMGFEVCRHVVVSDLSPDFLSETFEAFEKEDSHFNYDGVVIYPDIARDKNFEHEIKNSRVTLPDDRRAWKVRVNQKRENTRVIEVSWNVGASGKMIPVIVHEPVMIDSVKISRVTGHNAKVIFGNKIGPDSIITISRSNDTIPKLEGIVQSTEAQMPSDCKWEWRGETDIYQIGDSLQRTLSEIKKTLDKLGVENVGEGTIDKMISIGLDDIFKIYKASRRDFMRMERIGEKSADNIYKGLRKNMDNWKIVDLMVSSLCFPQLVGESKLNALITKYPDWKNWSSSVSVFGISNVVLPTIVECVPKFSEWYEKFKEATGIKDFESGETSEVQTVSNQVRPYVCFTGGIDPTIQAILNRHGYDAKDSITKTAKLLIYKDNNKKSSKHLTAEKYGIKCVHVSNFDPKDLS